MLKSILPTVIVVTILFFSSLSVAENNVKINNSTKEQRVYLLLGQSNMAGQGLVSELSDDIKTLESNITLYLHGKPVSLSTLNKFGPEVSFAHEMAKKHLDSSIHLIKFAPGGSLMKDWTSKDVGKHYDTLIKQVKKSSGGTIPSINGILWMHGERDTKSKQLADDYEKDLKVFIAMLKSDFKVSKLPIALARISIPAAFRPAVPEVRLAQEHIAESSSFIHLVSTDDLSKKNDKVHFNSKGQLALGKRFAQVFMRESH
ncbi:MAG TPA: hypothetical protein EYG68_03640 [Leucothrix mucor]|nr:hypothetical protein [Leucothrix mucor]